MMTAVLVLLPAGDEPENPWKGRVPDALARVAADPSAAVYGEALDTAYRADDWRAALKLAREAVERHGDEAALYGPVARAFWRAGLLTDAEKTAARIDTDTRDRIAMSTLVAIHAARGEFEDAERYGDRLAQAAEASAADLQCAVLARFGRGKMRGMVELLRRAERKVDVANGYPENFLADELDGLAEFVEAVGSEPLNQIARHGSAPMPPVPLIRLPGCEVYINGRGPYRMIVDTGGSVTLSVDDAVAEEAGLKTIVSGTIRGVGGKEESGQALAENVQIGEITCRRVMTRVFGVRKTAGGIDGIVGTGIFAEGRLTLDFENGRLIVAPSSAEAARGNELPIRVIGDAKIVAPLEMEGGTAVALFDSGADMVVLTPSKLRELFPDRPIRSVTASIAVGVGGESAPEISFAPGVDLVIAGRAYDDISGLGLDVLDTLLSPVLGVQCDVLVGMPVFRDMRCCTVDFPRCRMWIDWLKVE